MHRLLCIGLPHSDLEPITQRFQTLKVTAAASILEALPQVKPGLTGIILATPLPEGSEAEFRATVLRKLGAAAPQVVSVLAGDRARLLQAVSSLCGPLVMQGAVSERSRVAFAANSRQWLQDLRALQGALSDGSASVPMASLAARAAHKLAGTAALFGFPGVTEPARVLEPLLAGAAPELDRPEIPELMAAILAAMEPPVGTPPAPPAKETETEVASAGTMQASVLIADNDELFVKSLEGFFAAEGINLIAAKTLAAARHVVASTKLDAAILDLTFPGDPEGGYSLLQALSGQNPSVPVMVLTSTGLFDSRLKVSRMGAELFLNKPAAPQEVLKAVKRMLRKTRGLRSLVLAVDDDHVSLELVGDALAGAPVELIRCSAPALVWTLMEEHQPDLVLLDVEMPGSDGIELCRVIRSDPRFQSIPVIFLTAYNDPGVLKMTFDAGADDFVAKPIRPVELRARVEARLERSQMYRQNADIDALTGVMHRHRFIDLFQRYLGLARRSETPLSIAVLDMDHFKSVNDRFGHPMGDLLLRRFANLLQSRVRREDLIARAGGEEFLVAMLGLRKEEAAARLREVLHDLRADPMVRRMEPTFSGGVAEFPGDGIDLDGLYRCADAALYSAKARGRARVLSFDTAAHTALTGGNALAKGPGRRR